MTLAQWDTKDFGPSLENLLGKGNRLPSLAPPKGAARTARKIQDLISNGIYPGKPIKSRPEVQGLASGLYLYFDILEPAHLLAQDIRGPMGALWHGMMHRREPDDGNVAYWFRQFGGHLALRKFGSQALKYLRQESQTQLVKSFVTRKEWDPFFFIKACSVARKSGSADDIRLLNELQLLEWRILFEHCFWKGYR